VKQTIAHFATHHIFGTFQDIMKQISPNSPKVSGDNGLFAVSM